MIAVIFSPLYILVCIYFFMRIIKYLNIISPRFKNKIVKIIIIVIYTVFATSLVTAVLTPEGTMLKRITKQMSNWWLGTILYMALIVGLTDIISKILKIHWNKKRPNLFTEKVYAIIGTICLVSILTISIGGNINAGIIRTTNYDISVNKSGGNIKNLNIVMVADFHLGYNIGVKQMQQMANKINKCNPDIVVIAGDIFDNDYDSIEKPNEIIEIFKSIKSKYGTYACYGNHDINEKILAGFTFDDKDKNKKTSDARMNKFLENANIKLLKDEYELIDNSFYLYGRADYQKPNLDDKTRKTPSEITSNLDKTKPIIVIDHEPRELAQLADAGVDIDLGGHTHDGQTFPGNLVTKFMWENSCGLLKKSNMYSIVTSGVGIFGPYMRVGTKAEICNIKVNFTK